MSLKCRTAILELQKKYPKKRSALIPALHMAQEEVGYLPLTVQQEVAELFDLDVNEVQAIVTFYDMFFEAPVREKVVHVCKNLSCMLRGADLVIEKLEATKDKYTIIPSECLGACDLAPMMIVNDKVVGNLMPDTVLEEIDRA